jgi:hypothetical protein
MLVFPSALFLCISTLLLLPCPSYDSQPFGISLSSHHTRISLEKIKEKRRLRQWKEVGENEVILKMVQKECSSILRQASAVRFSVLIGARSFNFKPG